MEVTRFEEAEWEMNPPADSPSPRPKTLGKTLAQSPPDRVGRYHMIVRDYPESKPYPRHRHKIDQIRYTLKGESPSGPDLVTPAGSMVYVSSGTFYGPYDRPGGLELLSLEFDGADSAPGALGELDGAHMRLPKARFSAPIEINPRNFRWITVGEGVQEKELGVFTERETRIAMLGLDDGASHTFVPEQTTLVFVDSGAGSAGGQPISERDGLTIEAGEAIELTASGRLELVFFGMPKLTEA